MLIQFLWNLLTKIVVNSLDKIEELEMENYTFFIYSKDVDNVHTLSYFKGLIKEHSEDLH